MLQNIPAEMRAYRQWIVWRYEESDGRKATKMPYSPLNWSKLASVTNSATWATFEQACLALNDNDNMPRFDGIGFVLTKNDPFAFIDLDNTANENDLAARQIALDRQLRIFNDFNSYSEVSPSGQGLHIIVKGDLECGRRRSYIEIYSSERYMTMTGNVYKHAPIEERQELLISLWQQMGGSKALMFSADEPQRESDDDILNHASSASNGDKFKRLFMGDWKEFYGSQSEADFALIDIVAFYSQNREQITRIFLSSQLGKREKAKRKDYVHQMVNRAFDRQSPAIDMEGLNNQLELALSKKKAAASSFAAASSKMITLATVAAISPTELEQQTPLPFVLLPVKTEKFPPGLVGEIAQFIFDASPRPVVEISLAAALGLMSGICGKAYNINGAGLNQYILLLALTGTGKEGMQSGISRLMKSAKTPYIDDSMMKFIGPAIINSGQALIKKIVEQTCCVSIVGEFGNHLKQMSAANANSSQLMLKTMLLDLYHKSGQGNVFGQSIYSNKENSTATIDSPAFSILGECNPRSFYDQLNEEMVSDGLLPRFTLIEYKGDRVPLSPTHMLAQPSMLMLDKFRTLISQCLSKMNMKLVVDVGMTPEAQTFLNEFELFTTNQINKSDGEVIRQLWNRAHIKTLKLASLVAIGCDHGNSFTAPIITIEHARWAHILVCNDVWSLLKRFERGEIGKDTTEAKQHATLSRVIRDFYTCPIDDLSRILQYSTSKTLWDAKVMPLSYLQRRLLSHTQFKNDRAGATNSLARVIKSFIETDTLREVPRLDMKKLYNTTARAFMLSDTSLLDLPKDYAKDFEGFS